MSWCTNQGEYGIYKSCAVIYFVHVNVLQNRIHFEILTSSLIFFSHFCRSLILTFHWLPNFFITVLSFMTVEQNIDKALSWISIILTSGCKEKIIMKNIHIHHCFSVSGLQCVCQDLPTVSNCSWQGLPPFLGYLSKKRGPVRAVLRYHASLQDHQPAHHCHSLAIQSNLSEATTFWWSIWSFKTGDQLMQEVRAGSTWQPNLR